MGRLSQVFKSKGYKASVALPNIDVALATTSPQAAPILAALTKEAALSEPTNVAELQSQLATLQAEAQSLTASKSQLEASLATALADKSSVETQLSAALADLDKYKAETISKERKAKLAEVLPEDQVETMFSSTQALDDGAFLVVLSALETKMKAEDAAMAELGQAGADAKQEDYVTALANNAKQSKGK